MPDLGQILKAAREAKGVTPSEVAAATNIMVRHVQALEANDFSKMAAPAYAKGFIRLYAEFLDLDPVPLVEEYIEASTPKPAPSMVPEEEESVLAPKKEKKVDPLAGIPVWMERLKDLNGQRIMVIAGGVILALFLLSAISRFVSFSSKALQEPRGKGDTLSVIEEPPPPYLDEQEGK